MLRGTGRDGSTVLRSHSCIPAGCQILRTEHRIWHPAGVRPLTMPEPGVSLRSTPGYLLTSLQDVTGRLLRLASIPPKTATNRTFWIRAIPNRKPCPFVALAAFCKMHFGGRVQNCTISAPFLHRFFDFDRCSFASMRGTRRIDGAAPPLLHPGGMPDSPHRTPVLAPRRGATSYHA